MKPKTVNEVIEELRKLQIRGFGEHILQVSNDEECNGYHSLLGWCIVEGDNITYLNEETNKMETRPSVQLY